MQGLWALQEAIFSATTTTTTTGGAGDAEAAAEDVEEDADGAEVDGTAGRGGVSMR